MHTQMENSYEGRACTCAASVYFWRVMFVVPLQHLLWSGGASRGAKGAPLACGQELLGLWTDGDQQETAVERDGKGILQVQIAGRLQVGVFYVHVVGTGISSWTWSTTAAVSCNKFNKV
jgi:hypothetical protein